MKIRPGLALMAAAYVTAGLLHFARPDFYRPMMPPYLPAHDLLIYVSGVAEIMLGLLLIPRRTRAYAGYGLLALLVAVFPANVQMYLERDTTFANIPAWALLARLPFQFVLMYWAYKVTRGRSRG